jgi:opacity protein-like surface antigen
LQFAGQARTECLGLRRLEVVMPFPALVRVALLIVFAVPSVAKADWIFTPHFGTTFGADTHGNKHPTMGGSIALFDDTSFGWEADVSFAPNFFRGRFGTVDFTGSRSNVLTVMGNAVVSMPIAGQYRDRLRPYGTGGLGFMQMHVESPIERNFFKSTVWEPGWNAGGGILALITNRVGVRGDVRYIRSFQNRRGSWTQGIDFDVAPGSFDFFRATAGVTLRVGRID